MVDLANGMTKTLRRHATSPAWGPHTIAFGTTHKRGGQTIWNVATIRQDGSHFRQLTHIHPTNFYFGLTPAAWSANGQRLATATMAADGYWFNTYVVDAVHGGARLLFRGLTNTTISRNGRWIIGQTGDPECCGLPVLGRGPRAVGRRQEARARAARDDRQLQRLGGGAAAAERSARTARWRPSTASSSSSETPSSSSIRRRRR